MATLCSNKRRRSTSTDQGDSLTTWPSALRRKYGDTYISGSGNVQLGDRIYLHNNEELPFDHLQKSLCFPGMHERYESLREAANNTYKWILEPKEGEKLSSRDEHMARYFRWYQDGTGMFWVSGKPGSGKSTLMKYLVENTTSRFANNDSTPPPIFSFFFWIGGSELQRNRLGCMRSLLWQVLQLSSTRETAVQACQSHFQGVWTDKILRVALSDVLKKLDVPVTMFLDGLDESSDHDDVLDFLTWLSDAPQIKLCVSSRPEATLVDSLQSCSSLRLQDLNHGDIRHVIKTRFLDHSRVQNLSDGRITTTGENNALSDLSRAIEWKADGVFLWVILAIKDLLRGITQKDSFSTLLRRLERLPADLNCLYQDMLQRMNPDSEVYREDTATYFALVLHREFFLIEFCFAIDQILRQEYLNPSIFDKTAVPNKLIDCETVASWICTRTAGLLEIDGQGNGPSTFEWVDTSNYESYIKGVNKNFDCHYIRFIHRTAHDFVQSTVQGQSYLRPSPTSSIAIEQICFETMLIINMILPGLQGVLGSCAETIGSLDCDACDQELLYELLKNQGRAVIDTLGSVGIWVPDTNNWIVKWGSITHHICLFPSSRYAKMDLLPLLIWAGNYTMALMWLDGYNCEYDTQYLTMLLVELLVSSTSSETLHPKFWELLRALITGGADLRQNIEVDTGEVVSPLGVVLVKCRNLFYGSSADESQKIVQSLSLLPEDLLVKSWPSCSDCHMIWHQHQGANQYKERIEFWGVLHAPRGTRNEELMVLQSKEEGSLKGLSRDEDQILVMASYRCESTGSNELPRLWAISPLDACRFSANLSQYARSVNEFLAPGIHAIIFQNPNMTLMEAHDKMAKFRFGDVEPHDAGPVSPTVHIPTQLLRDKFKVTSKSSPLISFATAMERLGKSQKTIMEFHREEENRTFFRSESERAAWKQWFWEAGVDVDIERDCD